jgi:hypothetical protein
VLNVEQGQHERIRPCRAESGGIGAAGCDPQGSNWKTALRGNDANRHRNENQVGAGHALVHVLE